MAEAVEDGELLSEADLVDFAEHLAAEFDHDRGRAIWEPSLWYQAQAGEDVCSERQAMRLRQMTIERCRKLGTYPEEIEAAFMAGAEPEPHTEAEEEWPAWVDRPWWKLRATEAARLAIAVFALACLYAAACLFGGPQ